MVYELTFLLNEEAELKNIKELIKSLSGRVLEEQSWGKKTLCYPVRKCTLANFYNWRFEIASENLTELKRKLNFNEKLIRYLILKVD
jgi:small subunit ribosomal protein S6